MLIQSWEMTTHLGDSESGPQNHRRKPQVGTRGRLLRPLHTVAFAVVDAESSSQYTAHPHEQSMSMPEASSILVSCIMLWRSPALCRLHDLQSNILKQHVADPELLCITTPCQPTSCSILGIANRTLRQSLEVCLAADPGDCLRVIPWRAEKASSCALSAASETPCTNPKAGGSRSSPISRRCKERVPGSLDAGIFPLFGCDTAGPCDCLHSYTWLAIIANHMQHLLFRAASFLFFVSTHTSERLRLGR